MSDITSDWMPFETQTVTEPQTASSVKTLRPYCREREFRSALDHYMAVFARASALIG